MSRLLSLDLGERRIGVAISDPTQTLARPLTTLIRASREEDFAAIASLVDEYQAEWVIVGLPLNMDGTEGPQAQQTRRYAERLSETLSVPIEFWDERYSSQTAQEILQNKGKRISSRRRKEREKARARIDATAAAVFLQTYLDARAPWPGDALENGDVPETGDAL